MTRTRLLSPTLTGTHRTVTAVACAALGLSLLVCALRDGGLLIALSTGLVWWLSNRPTFQRPLTANVVAGLWLLLSLPGLAVILAVPLVGPAHPLVWLTIATAFTLSVMLLHTVHAQLTQLRTASSF